MTTQEYIYCESLGSKRWKDKLLYSFWKYIKKLSYSFNFYIVLNKNLIAYYYTNATADPILKLDNVGLKEI